MSDLPPAARHRPRRKRLPRVTQRRWQPGWWATLIVVTALGSLWALASPLFSVPDEPAHVIRAAAAARGQILPGERTDKGYSTIVEVPEVFRRSGAVPACYAFGPDVTAGCAVPFSGSDRPTEVETSAGLYPPAYYAVVGLPSLAYPSATGVYLMRILNAALCGALLASALASARLIQPPRLLVAGVAAAVTPQVLFLAGSVNPNGVEIAAAIGLWVSLAVLLTHGHRQGLDHTNRLLARVAVAGSVLALSRPGSPLWVALVVATVVVWAGRPAVALLRSWRALLVAGVVALATASTVAWVARFDTLDQTLGAVPPAGSGLRDHVRIAVGATPVKVQQMIGVFGWLDTGPATLSIYLWLFAIGALVVLALASPGRRCTAVLVGLAAAVVLVPVVLQVPRAATQGFPWQGRYTLPLAVGLPILAALKVDQTRLLFERLTRGISVTLLVLLGVGQLYAHVWATRRYTAGVHGPLNWFTAGGWTPPLPVWALFVGFLVVLAVAALGLQRFAEQQPAPLGVTVAPSWTVTRPVPSDSVTLLPDQQRELADLSPGTGER